MSGGEVRAFGSVFTRCLRIQNGRPLARVRRTTVRVEVVHQNMYINLQS